MLQSWIPSPGDLFQMGKWTRDGGDRQEREKGFKKRTEEKMEIEALWMGKGTRVGGRDERKRTKKRCARTLPTIGVIVMYCKHVLINSIKLLIT